MAESWLGALELIERTPNGLALAQPAAQKGVDEARLGVAAHLLGEGDRLVDGGMVGDSLQPEQLVESQAQDHQHGLLLFSTVGALVMFAAWPLYVRINDDLPHTATNKILKRELSAAGVTAGDGVLWERAPRGRSYSVSA